jgi:hypothetical protein
LDSVSARERGFGRSLSAADFALSISFDQFISRTKVVGSGCALFGGAVYFDANNSPALVANLIEMRGGSELVAANPVGLTISLLAKKFRREIECLFPKNGHDDCSYLVPKVLRVIQSVATEGGSRRSFSFRVVAYKTKHGIFLRASRERDTLRCFVLCVAGELLALRDFERYRTSALRDGDQFAKLLQRGFGRAVRNCLLLFSHARDFTALLSQNCRRSAATCRDAFPNDAHDRRRIHVRCIVAFAMFFGEELNVIFVRNVDGDALSY